MALKVASVTMDGGLISDRTPPSVPPNTWTAAGNAVFREGVAERAKGWAAIGGATTVCSPRHLVAMNAGESYLLGAAATLLFYAGDPYAGAPLKIGQVVPSTGVHLNVSPVAWAAAPSVPGQFTGGLLNGIPYFAHRGYSPVDFRAGAPFAVLPDWAATHGAGNGPAALRHFREFYVALGLQAAAVAFDQDVVNWSARAAPLTTPAVWLPAAGNAAGNAVLTGGGDMVDGAPLGDDFIIYKRRAIWAMRYVGGNYIFAFERRHAGIGALSQNCIAVVGRQHIFLTEDDLMIWDGSGQPQSLIAGRVRKQLVGQMNDAGYASSHVLHLPREKEIWACFPTGIDTLPNKAIVFDLKSGHAGLRDCRFICHGTYLRDATTSTRIGDTVLAYNDASAASNGRIELVEAADTADGVTIVSFVSREASDFGLPGVIKKLRWIRPWAKAKTTAIGMSVAAAGSMTPAQTLSYGASVTFTTGTTDKINVFAEGRYISLRFSSSTGGGWELPGFDAGYEVGGAE